MEAAEALAAGTAALAEGRWADARAAFEALTTLQTTAGKDHSAECLEGMARVHYGEGDYATAITLREQAYSALRADGELRRAAVLAAYHLAFDHAAFHGNHAVANGWLQRGKRLIAAADPCAEAGWVELACAMWTDDEVDKLGHVEAAMRLARRFGDADLEFDALAYTGLCHVSEGRIASGMDQLDEAAAAAMGGEVGDVVTAGEIYCKMLLACEMTLDVSRAAQWTKVADRLDEAANLAWAPAICRTHHGGVLIAAGRWPEAETTLADALTDYDRSYPALRSAAITRLADLRCRQGRHDEAEGLLAGHEDDTYAVRPAARVQIVRGQVDVAATMLRRHVDRHGDGFLQTPVLALLIEALVAADRPLDARQISGRLRQRAAGSPLPAVRAMADLAEAGVLTAAEDPAAAGRFEAALAGFVLAGLPYEEARARLGLARALRADSTPVAIVEAQTALATFQRLGARRDVDEAASLLRAWGGPARTGPKDVGLLSQRQQEVLHLVGQGLTNPEIAARLFISRKTASQHVSNILARLGLRNRVEAAAYASRVFADPSLWPDDGRGSNPAAS